jgi:hypothetical protein
MAGLECSNGIQEESCMASQSTPDKIRHINEKLSNDVKTVHREDGDEVHQQVTSATQIVEENDSYPAFMQNRLHYLHRKIADIEEWRTTGIGSLAIMGLIGAVVSIGSGVTLAAGIGLAILDIVTGCALIGLVHLATKPALKKAQEEERGVFDALAGYHKEKSLAMAAHANQDDPAGKSLPVASLQSSFAAQANAAQPAPYTTPQAPPPPTPN